MDHSIDEIDIAILRLLQHNARMPVSQISREVSMSQPSVKERILKLEEKQILTGYTAVLNLEELDMGTTTFILLKTELCQELVDFCREAREVTDLYRISGEYNYLLQARTSSIAQLAEFQDALMRFGPSKSHISLKNIMEHRVML